LQHVVRPQSTKHGQGLHGLGQQFAADQPRLPIGQLELHEDLELGLAHELSVHVGYGDQPRGCGARIQRGQHRPAVDGGCGPQIQLDDLGCDRPQLIRRHRFRRLGVRAAAASQIKRLARNLSGRRLEFDPRRSLEREDVPALPTFHLDVPPPGNLDRRLVGRRFKLVVWTRFVHRVVDQLGGHARTGDVDRGPAGIVDQVVIHDARVPIDVDPLVAVGVRDVAMQVTRVGRLDSRVRILVAAVLDDVGFRAQRGDARDVLANHVAFRVGSVVQMDADQPVFRHGVAGHQHVAGGEDPVAVVLVHTVAQTRRQIAVAHHGPRGARIDDVDPRAVAVDFAGLDQAAADAAQRQADSSVVVHLAVRDADQQAVGEDPVPAVVVYGQPVQDRAIRVPFDRHAVFAVIEQGQVLAHQVVAALAHVDAGPRPEDHQVPQFHLVGSDDVERFRAAIFVGAIDGSDAVQIGRPADQRVPHRIHPRIERHRRTAQVQIHRVDIAARIDAHLVARVQVVRQNQGPNDDLGIRGRGARIAIVSDGRGVLVVRRRLVVDIERVSLGGHDRGNRKRFARRRRQRRGSGGGQCNAVAFVRVAADEIARRPCDRARRDLHRGDIPVRLRPDFDQVDIQRIAAGHLVGLPTDLVAAAGHQVHIEIRRRDSQPRGRRGSRLGRIPVGAQVDPPAVRVGFPAVVAARMPCVDGRRFRHQMEVVFVQAYEPRVVPRRVRIGAPDAVQIHFGFDLPIVDIVKALALEGDPASAGGVQVVVVAGIAELAVGLDVQPVTGLGVNNVVANQDLFRKVPDPHAVAAGGVDRVVHDVHVAGPFDQHAVPRIAIDQVVMDPRVALDLDPGSVFVDAVVADFGAVLGQHADLVRLDQIVQLRAPAVGPDGVRPANPDRVVMDMVGNDPRSLALLVDPDFAAVADFVEADDDADRVAGDQDADPVCVHDINGQAAGSAVGRGIVGPQHAAAAGHADRILMDQVAVHVRHAAVVVDAGLAPRDVVVAHGADDAGREVDARPGAAFFRSDEPVVLDQVGLAAVDLDADVDGVEHAPPHDVALGVAGAVAFQVQPRAGSPESDHLEQGVVRIAQHHAGNVAAGDRADDRGSLVFRRDHGARGMLAAVQYDQIVRSQVVAGQDALQRGLRLAIQQAVPFVVAGRRRVVTVAAVQLAGRIDVDHARRAVLVRLDGHHVVVPLAGHSDVVLAVRQGVQRDDLTVVVGVARSQQRAEGIVHVQVQIAVNVIVPHVHGDAVGPQKFEFVPIHVRAAVQSQTVDVQPGGDSQDPDLVGRREFSGAAGGQAPTSSAPSAAGKAIDVDVLVLQFERGQRDFQNGDFDAAEQQLEVRLEHEVDFAGHVKRAQQPDVQVAQEFVQVDFAVVVRIVQVGKQTQGDPARHAGGGHDDAHFHPDIQAACQRALGHVLARPVSVFAVADEETGKDVQRIVRLQVRPQPVRVVAELQIGFDTQVARQRNEDRVGTQRADFENRNAEAHLQLGQIEQEQIDILAQQQAERVQRLFEDRKRDFDLFRLRVEGVRIRVVSDFLPHIDGRTDRDRIHLAQVFRADDVLAVQFEAAQRDV